MKDEREVTLPRSVFDYGVKVGMVVEMGGLQFRVVQIEGATMKVVQITTRRTKGKRTPMFDVKHSDVMNSEFRTA